jgi:hypothetical protein
MEPDERIRVQPMPTCTVPTVDHDDADVGVVDQRIRERHPHRAGADDHIVSFQHRHGFMLTGPHDRVNSHRHSLVRGAPG